LQHIVALDLCHPIPSIHHSLSIAKYYEGLLEIYQPIMQGFFCLEGPSQLVKSSPNQAMFTDSKYTRQQLGVQWKWHGKASKDWPAEFKASTMVVISKPGKPWYDTPKSFCPIFLLNTLGKMFEKMLSNRLQFEAAKHRVLHPNQCGGVCQNSTKDAGCFLTHIVWAEWCAKLKTSMVAFDLAQFFPSINHDVLLSILDKQGFTPEVVMFFRSYLVN
jgi:hypothetical protein